MVTVEMFDEVGARRGRQLEEQVERVGAVVEGRVEWSLGPVSVGPHA